MWCFIRSRFHWPWCWVRKSDYAERKTPACVHACWCCAYMHCKQHVINMQTSTVEPPTSRPLQTGQTKWCEGMQVDIIYKGFHGLFYMSVREVLLTFTEWNGRRRPKRRMAACAWIGWSREINDYSLNPATLSQSFWLNSRWLHE